MFRAAFVSSTLIARRRGAAATWQRSINAAFEFVSSSGSPAVG